MLTLGKCGSLMEGCLERPGQGPGKPKNSRVLGPAGMGTPCHPKHEGASVGSYYGNPRRAAVGENLLPDVL